MFRNLLLFLKKIFCKQRPECGNFAILNDQHNTELKLRIKKLELASLATLTTLKYLIQLKSGSSKLPFDNHITDDTKQPTIH
jgi:hypothetical protein